MIKTIVKQVSILQTIASGHKRLGKFQAPLK